MIKRVVYVVIISVRSRCNLKISYTTKNLQILIRNTLVFFYYIHQDVRFIKFRCRIIEVRIYCITTMTTYKIETFVYNLFIFI